MPGLISTQGQIWLSVAPVDLRMGIDGFSALVQQTLGQQPCAGSAFVFRNASGNRIKVLLWDGTWPNSRIDELLPFAHPVEDGSIQDEKVDD